MNKSVKAKFSKNDKNYCQIVSKIKEKQDFFLFDKAASIVYNIGNTGFI